MACLFFDIDGTLIDYVRGPRHIPPAIAAELRRLAAAGHALMLATGRPRSMVEDHLWEGFAGAVLAGGAHVVVAGETVFEHPMDPASARAMAATFERLGCPYLVECADATYLGPGSEALYAFFERYGRAAGITREPVDAEAHTRALKMEANVGGDQVGEVRAALARCPELRHLEIAGAHDADFSFEVMPRGVTKAGGVRVALDVLGGTREESLAFGDGAIDVEMLEWCGCGVAMANAAAGVRARSDAVCGDVHEAGLAGFLRQIS